MNPKLLLYTITMGSLLLWTGMSHAVDKLLQKSDFTYLGAFRVPKVDMGGPLYQGLGYGGSVIAYNADNNSLFIVGHGNNQMVGEISIPKIINSPNISELQTAEVIQNLAHIDEGNLENLLADGSTGPANGVKIGGLIRYGNQLIGSAYAYYDGGAVAVRSHFKSGLTTTTTGDFEGMLQLGTNPSPVPQAGFVGGYMTPIPANWQTALGGKVLTGMSAIPVISRSSSGHAAFSFDPDQLTATSAPATALLYYPVDNQTIGGYYDSDTLFHMGTKHGGSAFPSGTRSIIYTGKHGLGESCYGPGTNVPEEHGNVYNNPYPDNLCMGEPMTNMKNPCCYDPLNLAKGGHAYPYAYYVWAYDAQDLFRVKNGGRIVDDPSANLVDSVSPDSTETYKPWHIQPYAHWEFDLPYQRKFATITDGASAYDELTHRLYISQPMIDDKDNNGNYVWPIIHVYQINVSSQILKMQDKLKQM